MILEGTIEEIIFRNDDNGYTVAVLEHNEQYSTVVGKFLSINIGENVRLVGEFVTNQKYGEQFSFTSSEVVFPSTVEGIEKYLASGLIKGVGPVTAKAIVKEFKEDTLEIIEMFPERLEKIRGISKNKAREISECIGKFKSLQNTMIFLQSYNITTNLALKIFEIYQEKTVELVKENPYRLVEDIDGIGFQTADKIAKNMGIKENSPFRVRAGFLYVLTEMSDKIGHTFVYKDVLLEETASKLELELDYVIEISENIITNLVFDRVITVFKRKGIDIVMLTKYYMTESISAQKLTLLNISAKEDNFDVSSEINAYEKINNLKLHEEQKNAIQNAVNSGVSVITGGPGTGKTTIVKCILNILKQAKKKVLLVAPTGRAAKRLSETTGEEAKTIHRALEIDFKGEHGRFKHNENNPLDIDCLIIDEVSMVDIMLMCSVLKALKRDCKLILVGDKDQLPSVGAGNVLDDIIKSETIKINYLTQIFRQDENSLIITNAHKINSGEMPEIDNSSKDFFFESKLEPIDVKNSIIDLVTERIPNYFKVDIAKIQILAPLKAGVSGVESLNQELQEKLNPPSYLKYEIVLGRTVFREGDKVMQTANNYDLCWKKTSDFSTEEGMGIFNGDIGYIHKINRQNGEVTVWFDDGRECTYPRTEIGDLSLAYAITIHKSQGSEFDIVVIPLVAGAPMILTRNLIYTAVTRAKKTVMLVGDKKVLNRMIKNTFVVKRNTMLQNFLVESNDKIQKLFG